MKQSAAAQKGFAFVPLLLLLALGTIVGALQLFSTTQVQTYTKAKRRPAPQITPTPVPLVAATPSSTARPTPRPTILPTVSPSPLSTTLPTVTPLKFTTLSPGSALPSSEACATRVRRNTWEPRPDNRGANTTIAIPNVDYNLIVWGPDTFGQNIKADSLRQRINGNFTGTTDEILRWVACKWGIDEDIVRAQAANESWWKMSTLGDPSQDSSECNKLGKSAPCSQSYGILQIKGTVHPKTYPASEKSTAFNADYSYAYWRSCYEGYIDWLKQSNPSYGAGDLWGCVGHWYSGGWHDGGAENYILQVKGYLNTKQWAQSGF